MRICVWTLLPVVALLGAPAAEADDWTNAGGNAGRNGQSAEIGPDAQDLLWSGGPTSVIAWQPVTLGRRVFVVRQTGFPPGGEPNGSPVVALDLDTGAELWRTHIPYNDGDWTTWIAGARGGRVYAGRSGNGASVSASLYALDAETGDTLWISADEVDAGFYDGVVFAPDGDLLVGSFEDIWRIDADTGETVWHAERTCSVSSSCGGAIHDESFYVVDAVPGGHAVIRYDLATGDRLYEGELMPGFLVQNTPMVGPDGTIYFHRVQNNPAVDFFYALADDGSAITIKWDQPAGYATSCEFGVGIDGSVYMMGPGNEFLRLDPDDGSIIDTAGFIPADFSTPRVAVDADGKVYLSNGAFGNGAFYSFNADLSLRWSVSVPNINIGAPALGEDGTLIVAGTGTNLLAYRTERPCVGDLDGDDEIGLSDLSLLLANFGLTGQDLVGDLDDDGDVDLTDLSTLLNVFGTSCD